MLHELLIYCPETGAFRRLKSSGPELAGTIAGTINSHGYVAIRVGGRRYKAHRLAWFFAYGKWPTGQIDHANRNKADNRLANLREASPQQNRVNCVRPSRRAKTGFMGVEAKRGKFAAAVRINGIRHHLGTFLSPEEASAVYQAAAKKAFGQFFEARP